MKKLSQVVLSLGLLVGLFAGTTAFAADNCCNPDKCCQGQCPCPCCKK